ncbi:MAG: protein kinase [Planctomycetota bacterium]
MSTLRPGSSLGLYEIQSLVGAGGMGEVYRARDTRLDREVAIKVLPEHFARDPERIARFQREAKVLASLNHPNIAAIHGFEEVEGKRFLVMELVEGATLADRLHDGPLPVEDALTIGRQIAEALEAAHERGIIHRDLKPANVKTTPDGAVKVLDFGLAKAMTEELSPSQMAHSPTITAKHTKPGVVLGTAAYMSPEQARGKPVDKRTDIWSFGVVLYEALCGCRPFVGETATDLVAKILEREPDWSTLPPETPPIVQLLLRCCLAKDRNKRLHDIADARIDLEQAIADPTSSMLRLGDAAVSAADARIRQGARRRSAHWVLTGVVSVGLAIMGVSLWRATRPTPKPIVRLEVVVSDKEPSPVGLGAQVAISPDGTRLAYVIGTGNSHHLYLRALNQLEGTLLAGTEQAWNPFFSPDGQWVAFFSNEKLKKVSVLGGAPLTLCDVGDAPRGGTWGTDGTIVFAPNNTGGLWRISAAGGKAEELTKPDQTNEEPSHRWPQFLPDGKAVIFTNNDALANSYDEAVIDVFSLDTKQHRTLYRGGSYGRYVPSGHLVFVHQGTLFAGPFDLDRLELTGSPTPVLERVYEVQVGAAGYDFSQTGTLVYRREGPRRSWTLVWVDRQGTITTLVDTPRDYAFPALAPDGKRLAVVVISIENKENRSDVWVYDIERATMTRLTSDSGGEWFPVWTPDGLRVAYAAGKDWATLDILWKPADGAGEAERLTDNPSNQWPLSWSPDGKVLTFMAWADETQSDIWFLRLEGDRKPEVFLQTPSSENWARFSPDGRWLAYNSSESGKFEIFVRPFPTGDRKWQISNGASSSARWSPDGKELFYLQDKAMMVVAVSAEGSSFSADKPRKLFEFQSPMNTSGWSFDVAPDGQRFVMLKPAEEEKDADRTHLTFVFNWFEELKAKVPTK